MLRPETLTYCLTSDCLCAAIWVIAIFCVASSVGLHSCLWPFVKRLPFGKCRWDTLAPLSPPAVSTCRSCARRCQCGCSSWRRGCSWTLGCCLLIHTPLLSTGSPRTTCRTCTNGRRCACCCCRPSAWPSASPGWFSATRISKYEIKRPSVAIAKSF